MNFQITYEGRQGLQQIRNSFAGQLSEKEILKATAQALNITATRVQGFLKKEIKKKYTVDKKYQERISYVSHKAQADYSGLYSTVSLRYKTIPLVGFEHTGVLTTKGVNSRLKPPPTVTMIKGQTKTWKHAFIAKMRSGHIGIFAQGRYSGGKFVANKDSRFISELLGASPYTMALTYGMDKKINTYVEDSLPKRLQALLQRKVDKLNMP